MRPWSGLGSPEGRRARRRVLRWWLIRRLLASSLALLVPMALAGPALGHAELAGTEPADGVVLAEPPREVTLSFTKSVLVELSTFDLVDGDGRPVPIGAVSMAAGDGSRLVLELPALSTSAFRLNWRTVSEDDLHAASGTVVFGVSSGAAAGEVGAGQAEPRADEVALTWLGFLAFATLVGALAVGHLLPSGLLPDGGTPPGTSGDPMRGRGEASRLARIRRRLHGLALAAATIGLVVGALSIALKTELLAPAGAGPAGARLANALLGTGHGTRLVATEAVLLVAAIAVGAMLWRDARRAGRDGPAGTTAVRGQTAIGLLGAASLAVSLAALRALNSHSAGMPDDRSALAVAAATAHTLAAGAWVGGLVGLAVAIAPLLGRGPEAAALAVAVLRRFGWLAGTSLAVLLVSGLLIGGGLVASVDALLFSGYGHVLLVKLTLALAVALLGLANATALRVGRASAIRPLRRLVAAEAAAASGIVLLAATLAATPPAVGPAWSPPAEDDSVRPTAAGQADDLLFRLSVRPNRPGRNFVDVAVYDTRRPARAPIDAVVGEFVPAATGGAAPGETVRATLRPLGSGRYEAAIDLTAGVAPWGVTLVAQRSGLAPATFATSWALRPPLPSGAGSTVVSSEPLRPVLDRAAALAGLAAMAIAGLVLAVRARRRRRRLRPEDPIALAPEGRTS